MNARQAKKRYTYRLAKNNIICKGSVRRNKDGAVIARKLLHDGKRHWWLRKYGVRYIEEMRELNMKFTIMGKIVV